MFDIGADLQRAYDDGYKCGRLDALAELLKYIGEMRDYEADRKTEPQTEPNMILPERMERGEMYEVGDSIVVMNSEDYYDLLCKSWEKSESQTETQNSNLSYFRLMDERKMDEKIAKRVKERGNDAD